MENGDFFFSFVLVIYGPYSKPIFGEYVIK